MKTLVLHTSLAHRDWLPAGQLPPGHMLTVQHTLHLLLGASLSPTKPPEQRQTAVPTPVCSSSCKLALRAGAPQPVHYGWLPEQLPTGHLLTMQHTSACTCSSVRAPAPTEVAKATAHVLLDPVAQTHPILAAATRSCVACTPYPALASKRTSSPPPLSQETIKHCFVSRHDAKHYLIFMLFAVSRTLSKEYGRCAQRACGATSCRRASMPASTPSRASKPAWCARTAFGGTSLRCGHNKQSCTLCLVMSLLCIYCVLCSSAVALPTLRVSKIQVCAPLGARRCKWRSTAPSRCAA